MSIKRWRNLRLLLDRLHPALMFLKSTSTSLLGPPFLTPSSPSRRASDCHEHFHFNAHHSFQSWTSLVLQAAEPDVPRGEASQLGIKGHLNDSDTVNTAAFITPRRVSQYQIQMLMLMLAQHMSTRPVHLRQEGGTGARLGGSCFTCTDETLIF